MKLVIVESPTKAKTLSKVLSKDYSIKASNGHIRDLPKSGLGVDVDKNFEPEYIVPDKAKKTLNELKKEMKSIDSVILATDPDREGEAIAWHLEELLKPKKGKMEFKRVVFHELTKEAIKEAFENLGKLNMDLVDAQQARRVLDRLVGYKLSPLLWKKVMYGLSAGRVQSVAVRLVIERERERQAFKPVEYWSVKREFSEKSGKSGSFWADLIEKNNKKLEIQNEKQTIEIEEALKPSTFTVKSVKKSERKKNPYPPFKTSTLQQAMANLFGFPAKRTMRAAQGLFEKGYITYHRTDSFNLSDAFIKDARSYIKKEFGNEFLPEKPIFYKTTAKNAQEAHEAIRPTSLARLPVSHASITGDELKVYMTIWRRSLECQMLPAIYDQTTIDIDSSVAYTFRATGSVVKFFGWMIISHNIGVKSNGEENGNGGDDSESENSVAATLPDVKEGDSLDLLNLKSDQHFTQPPARYSDATLIKAMEELGVGRPSTYAPTLSTIQARGYVTREGRYFVPKDVAFVVNDLLVEHFPEIVDYNFTADMEEDLDEIAAGEKEWVPVIKEFFAPFDKKVTEKDKSLSKSEVTNLGESDEKCPDCGKPLIFKLGKYGKFLSCSGYPDCKYAKPLVDLSDEEKNTDYGKCPNCEDGKFILKQGRFGKFLACSNYPKCKTTQPFLDKIGMSCPKCETGEVVIKKARGRSFFGCSRYPDCDWSSWKDPRKIKGSTAKDEDNEETIVDTDKNGEKAKANKTRLTSIADLAEVSGKAKSKGKTKSSAKSKTISEKEEISSLA